MRSFYWILFILLGTANVRLYQTLLAPHVLEVRVFDVGKGDATLVRTPEGKTLLIDTGPDATILRDIGTTFPMWQRSLDAVILTSSAHGATGGLTELKERYRIRNLIHADPHGERFTLGDGAYLDVISPPKTVLRISYGSTTITISSSTPTGVYTSDGTVVK